VIRVLHLVHAFQTGGAERVVLDLTRHGSRSIENYVCSLCEPHDLASQLDSKRVGFRCLHKRNGNDLRVIAALATLIDEERIEVVHAQGWGTFVEGLLAAKWLAKRRPAFIFAFHGKSMEDVANGIPLRRRIAQRVGQCFTDACVAPARHMADDYARTIGLRRDRIEVICNGIDIDKFGRWSRRDARSALGLGPEDFVVGFVGRLDPVKDIRGLVEVFARFRKELVLDRERARLLIVGNGAELQTAESAIADRGLGESVLLAGLRTDIPQCMAVMDIYLQPSHYEGHSLTILEAMATGLPVVSTSVGGTPEIINNGRSGLLYRPGDYEQMAAAILNLYRQPALCSEIGNSGRERVAGHFSVDMMVRRYEELYRRVVRIVERPCVA